MLSPRPSSLPAALALPPSSTVHNTSAVAAGDAQLSQSNMTIMSLSQYQQSSPGRPAVLRKFPSGGVSSSGVGGGNSSFSALFGGNGGGGGGGVSGTVVALPAAIGPLWGGDAVQIDGAAEVLEMPDAAGTGSD